MLPASKDMKEDSEHIARSLMTATRLPEVDKLIGEAGVLSVSKPQGKRSDEPAKPPQRRIGIWEKREENGKTSYVRNSDDPFSGLWSNVERIDAKGERKRVLLVGESVARGIFYEPFLTPAVVLEKILNATLAQPAEVIDLARSDIGIYELRVLIEEALELEPDGIIIFAGNNWRFPGGSSSLDLVQTAESVRHSSDLELVSERARQALDSNIASLLRLLRSIVTKRNIPVVFLLPEFNLMNWRNEFCGQPPLMGASDLLQWQAWREEAEGSLAAGELTKAELLATRMIAADMGLVPVGYELMARCRLSAGDGAAAREYLELARDSGQFLPVHQSPRCYSAIQQRMRRDAPRHGIRLVDLPRLFAKRFGNAIPGRELFLDYCHLTSSGILVAMAAAAEQLLPELSSDPSCTGLDPFSVGIPADRVMEAHAHFLAAIHNARCGQEYEIVHHHCETALEQEPLIAATMRLYILAHLQPVPLLMSKFFWAMDAGSRAALTMQPMLRSMKPEREIAWTLLCAITDLLSNDCPHLREEIRLALKQQVAIAGNERANLLQKPFCSPDAYQLERDWEQRSTHFVAHVRRSVFWLPTTPGSAMQVRLACRVPTAASDEDCIRMFLNETLIHTMAASAIWQTDELVIPSDLISADSSTIVIEWPQPRWTREERINEIVRGIERGPISGARAGFPEIFAVFGELQSLTASCIPSLSSSRHEAAGALQHQV